MQYRSYPTRYHNCPMQHHSCPTQYRSFPMRYHNCPMQHLSFPTQYRNCPMQHLLHPGAIHRCPRSNRPWAYPRLAPRVPDDLSLLHACQCIASSQAVRDSLHGDVLPPMRPATAVRSSSAAGVTHLHEHDQFFSEKNAPCSAGTRPPFGRSRQLEGAGGKSLWLLRPAAANSMRHGYS